MYLTGFRKVFWSLMKWCNLSRGYPGPTSSPTCPMPKVLSYLTAKWIQLCRLKFTGPELSSYSQGVHFNDDAEALLVSALILCWGKREKKKKKKTLRFLKNNEKENEEKNKSEKTVGFFNLCISSLLFLSHNKDKLVEN